MYFLRIKHYIAFALVFFSWTFVCHAQVLINEVEILPTTERFIELYNNGSSSVDLTGWYIQRKTANSETFGSLVSKTYFEGKKISPGGYFLISKADINSSDIVYPDLTLTESNTIQLKDSTKSIIDSLEWESIPQGKSYQRINGRWQNSSPTPGDGNTDMVDDSDSESNDIDDDEDTTEENKNNDTKILKISTKIIADKIARAGVVFPIESLTTSNRGDTYAVGKYVWNFGDGSSYEDDAANVINHIYVYPGDYVINLSFYKRKNGTIPDTITKLNIKVVEPDISIVGIGSTKDPYIEIENKSPYDFSLDGWSLKVIGNSFIFPSNTVLLAKKKIKISSRVSGFTFENIKRIELLNPSSEIYASYPNTKNNSTYIKNNDLVSNDKNISNENTENNDSKDVINLNDLKANAKDSEYEFSYKALYILGLIFVVLLGIFTIFHFNKKPKYKDYPSELEGELQASDIKIIE